MFKKLTPRPPLFEGKRGGGNRELETRIQKQIEN
jgi:hypothetical protein